jgi:heptosyltransferase-2
VLLLGSPKDREVCDEIVALAPNARNIAGETTLKEAIALIAQSAAMVTNDSGLMHIAAALGRPIVAIYGPTDPRQTPPHSDLAKILWLHIECSPCHQRECPLGHHNCMRGITPQMAWEPLRQMLPVRQAGELAS